MSTLKNARIKAYIEQHFNGVIDLSNTHENDRSMALLTRGIACLAIMSYTGCEAKDAAEAIVDGGNDKGIDGVYYDSYTNSVYFVQSKWSNDGTRTIDESAAHKLKHGVQKLLDLDFDGCNECLKKKRPILEKITNDANVKIYLCLAYNSNTDISPSVKEILDDYINIINDGEELMSLVVANQGKIYEVASKTRGPINEDVVIRKWGKMDTGRPVYFGLVAASDLAALFEKHQDSLFIPNIRAFKGDTDVNNVIVESLLSDPSAFCYLNNGITVISTEVNRKPLGGASNESGYFECKGLAIVNGAQTAGACNRAYKLDPEKSNAAYVMIRLIETGQSDITLTDAITRATNTQNKIERKDFVALDSFQRQLKEELDILGIQYAFKSGEVLAASETSFDLSDLTQALIADTGDMALISLAKREIGRVWDDISKPPYKTLFNPSHNAYYMKHSLLLFAKIQKVIRPCAGDDRRKMQYTVHGNVFFAAECLKHVDKTSFDSDKFNLSAAYEKITCIAPQIFEKAFSICEHNYPGSYLAHLFRNREKITQINDLIAAHFLQ